MAELPIKRGQTERFAAAFAHIGNGTPDVPIDLTGVTVTLESDNSPITSAVTVTDAANGEVEVEISALVTASITRRERVRFKRADLAGDISFEDWFWLVPS